MFNRSLCAFLMLLVASRFTFAQGPEASPPAEGAQASAGTDTPLAGNLEGSLTPPDPVGLHYELLKTEIPNAHTSLGETSNSSDYAHHYEFALRLGEVGAPIFLARLYTDEKYDPDHKVGFDAESLRLEWLEPDRLLHISWETLNQGNGHFTVESHLLLQKVDGGWNELFRDSHGSAARYGWETQYRSDMGFEFEPVQSMLTLRSVEESNRPVDDSDPYASFAEEYTNSEGTTGRMLNYRQITEWKCQLADGRLDCLKGTRSLDLEERRLSAEGVAAMAASISGNADDRSKTLESLSRLNPSPAADGTHTGVVVIQDDIPPFRPDPGVYYCYVE